MSITALVVGQLIRAPLQRLGRTGKSFSLVRVSAAGEGCEVAVSVIAFGLAGEQLAGLRVGDRVAMRGQIRPAIWRGRDGELRAGLELTCEALLPSCPALDPLPGRNAPQTQSAATGQSIATTATAADYRGSRWEVSLGAWRRPARTSAGKTSSRS